MKKIILSGRKRQPTKPLNPKIPPKIAITSAIIAISKNTLIFSPILVYNKTGEPVTKCSIRVIIKMTTKTKNIILNTKRAKPLRPLKPKIPAISATTNEIIAISKNVLTLTLLNFFYYFKIQYKAFCIIILEYKP